MDLYNAQRTNFQTAMPRLATKPGQQRQLMPRSMNRGKAEMPMPQPAMPMPAGASKGQRPAPVSMGPGNVGGAPMLAKKPMPADGEMSIMPVKKGAAGPMKSADMIKKMAAFKPTGA
jgi:hypothetical protein